MDGGRKEVGERTDASPVPNRVVETHGPAISILLCSYTSFICNTYIVLTWGKIKVALVLAPLLINHIPEYCGTEGKGK